MEDSCRKRTFFQGKTILFLYRIFSVELEKMRLNIVICCLGVFVAGLLYEFGK